MEEKQSRTAMKGNLQDIQNKFKEVEDFNEQLQEYLEEDEDILADAYILTDLAVEVNCIFGLVEEHLRFRN